MSDVRKLRQELRQGLTQYSMQLYQSYCTTLGEAEAKQIVAEEIKSQYEVFTGTTISQKSTIDVLREKREELEEVLKVQTDYDSQLFYAEQIDALNAAIDVLNTN